MMDDAEKKISFWQVKTILDKKKGVYINEKMILETPSNTKSDFDSEYKDFSDREDIPF